MKSEWAYLHIVPVLEGHSVPLLVQRLVLREWQLAKKAAKAVLWCLKFSVAAWKNLVFMAVSRSWKGMNEESTQCVNISCFPWWTQFFTSSLIFSHMYSNLYFPHLMSTPEFVYWIKKKSDFEKFNCLQPDTEHVGSQERHFFLIKKNRFSALCSFVECWLIAHLIVHGSLDAVGLSHFVHVTHTKSLGQSGNASYNRGLPLGLASLQFDSCYYEAASEGEILIIKRHLKPKLV